MIEPPPRYRDYLSDLHDPQPTPHTQNPAFTDSAVVMKAPDGTWHAVWQGEHSIIDEFDGTQEDAIAWARQHSPRCWVYSEKLGDVVLLDADNNNPDA